jgi:hypothetical protein
LRIGAGKAHSQAMSTKSRNRLYGGDVRAAADRAAAPRKEADKLSCDAWNKPLLGLHGPAQPPPTLGDALATNSSRRRGASASRSTPLLRLCD